MPCSEMDSPSARPLQLLPLNFSEERIPPLQLLAFGGLASIRLGSLGLLEELL